VAMGFCQGDAGSVSAHVPSNLPIQATPFIGSEFRLLFLSGPGGTGKTRLALQGMRWLSTTAGTASSSAKHSANGDSVVSRR
jgi:hypothetical protein